MILAGDVGGTKCNLALFRKEGSVLRLIFEHRLATRNFAGFEPLVLEFLRLAKDATAIPATVEAAGFGLAGVVVDGCLHSENLRWALDLSSLQRKLDLKKIALLNDLTATACSLEKLSSNDFVTLNHGSSMPNATRAVIAAGTGLGQAILVWDGQEYSVAQSEGGQADFAPRTEREIRLLEHLRSQLPHVSCEEIVSGRGFRRIHEFLDPATSHESFTIPEGDSASEITQLAVAQSCPVCVETLNFWTEMYGAVAGNFALQTLPLGGIYVAGGIAPKILPKLLDGTFWQAFCGKSKLASVLERIPISVVVNEDAPVWGAAYQALAGGQSSAILTKSSDH